MSRTLAGLLREFNVEVVDNSRNWCRGARQTCAGRTLHTIFEMRGYEHLRAVIMSIVETKNNKKMLIAPVIWAISDVLMSKPEWFGDVWLQTLDEIELEALYERARPMREWIKPRAAVGAWLVNEMILRFTELA
jgi:hypothetical protein